jgi:hypothetical protein
MAFLDNSDWVRAMLGTQYGNAQNQATLGNAMWDKYVNDIHNATNPTKAQYLGQYPGLQDYALQQNMGFNPGQYFTPLGGSGYNNNVNNWLNDQIGAQARDNDIMYGASYGFKQGGSNPQFEQAFSQLNNLLSNQNPALQSQLGAGGDLLQSQGMSPFNTQYMTAGQNALSNNPLISNQQAQSMAVDRAATDARNAARAAQERAAARGGRAGSVTAGAANDAMADFADEQAQLQSNAAREALLGQQGLGLQQQGMMIGAGMQGADNALSRMGLGANLLGQAQGAQGQLLGQYGNLLGQQTQRELGLGGLAQTGRQSVIDAYENMQRNMLGVGQLNLAQDQNTLAQQQAMVNALMGNQGQSLGLMNAMNQNYQNQVLNPYLQFLQYPLAMSNAGWQGMYGLNAGQGGGSAFGTLAAGIGAIGQGAQGIGKMASGLGGMF